MRHLLYFITILFLSTQQGYSQKYMTQTGTISFFSSAPLEDITAMNNQVSGVIDLENGNLAFSLLMKAFKFEKALMQEHFNEKYVHSEEYPKATFKGNIENFSDKNLEIKEEVTINGELTMHGITKKITASASLQKQGETIDGHCVFNVNLKDYNISIPGAVKDNVSDNIEITVNMKYDKL